MNPKILYASFDVVPSPKGASTHILAFVKRLGAEFGNVVLATPNQLASFDPEFLPGVQHLEIECGDANPVGRMRSFRLGIESILKQQPFSIIHFRSIFAGVAACDPMLRRGAVLVYEANGFPSIELKDHYPHLAGHPRLLSKLKHQEDLCIQHADQVITVSQTTADYITDRNPQSSQKIQVIPNGADPDLFPYVAPQPVDDSIRIVYVGTASPWQGLEVLVDAVVCVNRTRQCELTILGPENRRRNRSLIRRIEKSNLSERIRWQTANSKSAVHAAFSRAHMTVVPLVRSERNSRQGCCPIKLIEAAASGCPIIASDLPVVRELLTPEVEFLPARQSDSRNLMHRILDLASDHPNAIGRSQAARSKFESRLTWQHATDRLVAVYNEVLYG